MSRDSVAIQIIHGLYWKRLNHKLCNRLLANGWSYTENVTDIVTGHDRNLTGKAEIQDILWRSWSCSSC